MTTRTCCALALIVFRLLERGPSPEHGPPRSSAMHRAIGAGSGRYRHSNVGSIKIIPSVLERSVAVAQRRIVALRRLRVPIELDLMDGVLVRTRSLGPEALGRLDLPKGTIAHLMVNDPACWTPACWGVGIRSLVVHVESAIRPSSIHHLNRHFHVSVAISPGTPWHQLSPFQTVTEAFRIMTVRPGTQGAQFLSSQLHVLSQLRRRYPHMTLSTDGGMNERTIPLAVAAGADEVVVGSALKTDHAERTFRSLRALAQRARRP